MSAAALLCRLTGVKSTAPGRWLAKCPAHDDKSPSLSVRELPDGRTLVHCFAGCATADVLSAVGLRMADLFDAPLPGTGPAGGYGPTHSRIPARDLLQLISEETSVVALIGADFLERRALGEPDWQRLAQAVARIGRAQDHAHG